MDRILTELHGANSHPRGNESSNDFVLRETRPTASKSITQTQATVNTPITDTSISVSSSDVKDLSELLTYLKSAPESEDLVTVIRAVDSAKPDNALYLRTPGPKEAQVIKYLVDHTIIDFWHVLSTTDRVVFASSLRSIAGIKAVLAAIQYLLGQAQTGERLASRTVSLSILLSVLDTVLPVDSESILKQLWSDLQHLAGQKARFQLSWREIVSLFGSGKIVSISAEAVDALKQSDHAVEQALSSGSTYATWFAKQIASMACSTVSSAAESPLVSAAQLLGKALTLGYTQITFRTLLSCLGREHDKLSSLPLLVKHLPLTSKQRFIEGLFSWLSQCFPNPGLPSPIGPEGAIKHVPPVCGLLVAMFQKDEGAQRYTVAFVQDAQLAAMLSLSVRRAIIAALAKTAPSELPDILNQTMAVFGDQLFIKHSPLLQQASLAQNVLLCAGYLRRHTPKRVLLAARSAQHMQGVSNRLACSSDRARWLGMVVGTAISRLVDEGITKIDFGTSDMETEEALAYLNLINITDDIGKADDLIEVLPNAESHPSRPSATRNQQTMPTINGKQTFGPLRPPERSHLKSTLARVVELPDESEEDGDLKPYAKPDSDPEDSDEDATLVNRKRVKPPVYIRTLMSMLRDNENAEKFQLGIQHAASLIRRKTGHGREVIDHAEELARILTNLQDQFDTEHFDQFRLQALVALVLSDVESIAPWLSRQAFASDYSIAQRLVMLTAIGIAGRELAGLETTDNLNPVIKGTDFPSKRLPTHLHALNDQSGEALGVLDYAQQHVEQRLIRPMALAAADETTSHLDAVKVRSFSSRMSVERTKRKPKANALAKVFYRTFFNPLLTSFQTNAAAYRSSSVYTSVPALLTTFVKTLAILVHASGPSTLELSQVTSDFWTLLLYLRVQAVESTNVMESLLFGVLTLFDINSDQQRIATDHPRELMETKEWVEMVFDRTGGGTLIEESRDEESRLRTLCAAVLTKANEVIEAYQKILMGRWTDL